jgi:hypothetical protein
MKRALLLLILATSCFAQQQMQQQQQVQMGTGPDAAPAETKLTPAEMKAAQAKARDLLQLAESEARGLDPGMRALSLSQIGAAYVGVNPKKATALLHDAFTATTEMDPDQSSDKRFLQDRIFSSLLGLEGDAVAELLPRAEPASRSRAYGTLISRAAQKKDFARATELVNTAAADSAPFPYDGVTQFMLAVPADDSGDRLNAFMQAYTAYSRNSKPEDGFSNQGFDRLIVRFGALLPKDITLKAIDEVLNRAKASDNEAKFTMSSSAGSASFNSAYDYYVFEFLPVLRRFDPAKADDLLQQNSQLQGTVSKFPNGVTSLDPTVRDTPPKPGEHSGMNMSISSNDKKGNRNASSSNPSAAASGPDMQQIMGQYSAEIARIQEMAAKEPQQATTQAMNLPESVGRMNVRAMALESVARASWSKNPTAARNAIDALVKAVANVDPDQRGRMLMGAADLYLKIKEEDAATKTIDAALKTAQALYETDSNPDDPNKALKGYWPSAALWAQCVALAYKVEPDKVPEILAGIKDDEIRTSIRIAYALALTGNTPSTITTMVSRKGRNSIMMNDNRAQ